MNTKSAAGLPPSESTVVDADSDVTLEEFCLRKSQVDRRVELLGAFDFDEKRAGHFKDKEAAFETRFQAFITKPA